jgi:hypothetical protein
VKGPRREAVSTELFDDRGIELCELCELGLDLAADQMLSTEFGKQFPKRARSETMEALYIPLKPEIGELRRRCRR